MEGFCLAPPSDFGKSLPSEKQSIFRLIDSVLHELCLGKGEDRLTAAQAAVNLVKAGLLNAEEIKSRVPRIFEKQEKHSPADKVQTVKIAKLFIEEEILTTKEIRGKIELSPLLSCLRVPHRIYYTYDLLMFVLAYGLATPKQLSAAGIKEECEMLLKGVKKAKITLGIIGSVYGALVVYGYLTEREEINRASSHLLDGLANPSDLLAAYCQRLWKMLAENYPHLRNHATIEFVRENVKSAFTDKAIKQPAQLRRFVDLSLLPGEEGKKLIQQSDWFKNLSDPGVPLTMEALKTALILVKDHLLPAESVRMQLREKSVLNMFLPYLSDTANCSKEERKEASDLLIGLQGENLLKTEEGEEGDLKFLLFAALEDKYEHAFVLRVILRESLIDQSELVEGDFLTSLAAGFAGEGGSDEESRLRVAQNSFKVIKQLFDEKKIDPSVQDEFCERLFQLALVGLSMRGELAWMRGSLGGECGTLIGCLIDCEYLSKERVLQSGVIQLLLSQEDLAASTEVLRQYCEKGYFQPDDFIDPAAQRTFRALYQEELDYEFAHFWSALSLRLADNPRALQQAHAYLILPFHDLWRDYANYSAQLGNKYFDRLAQLIVSVGQEGKEAWSVLNVIQELSQELLNLKRENLLCIARGEKPEQVEELLGFNEEYLQRIWRVLSVADEITGELPGLRDLLAQLLFGQLAEGKWYYKDLDDLPTISLFMAFLTVENGELVIKEKYLAKLRPICPEIINRKTVKTFFTWYMSIPETLLSVLTAEEAADLIIANLDQLFDKAENTEPVMERILVEYQPYDSNLRAKKYLRDNDKRVAALITNSRLRAYLRRYRFVIKTNHLLGPATNSFIHWGYAAETGGGGNGRDRTRSLQVFLPNKVAVKTKCFGRERTGDTQLPFSVAAYEPGMLPSHAIAFGMPESMAVQEMQNMLLLQQIWQQVSPQTDFMPVANFGSLSVFPAIPLMGVGSLEDHSRGYLRRESTDMHSFLIYQENVEQAENMAWWFLQTKEGAEYIYQQFLAAFTSINDSPELEQLLAEQGVIRRTITVAELINLFDKWQLSSWREGKVFKLIDFILANYDDDHPFWQETKIKGWRNAIVNYHLTFVNEDRLKMIIRFIHEDGKLPEFLHHLGLDSLVKEIKEDRIELEFSGKLEFLIHGLKLVYGSEKTMEIQKLVILGLSGQRKDAFRQEIIKKFVARDPLAQLVTVGDGRRLSELFHQLLYTDEYLQRRGRPANQQLVFITRCNAAVMLGLPVPIIVENSENSQVFLSRCYRMDPKAFEDALLHLAQGLAQAGVFAAFYGVMGDAPAARNVCIGSDEEEKITVRFTDYGDFVLPDRGAAEITAEEYYEGSLMDRFWLNESLEVLERLCPDMRLSSRLRAKYYLSWNEYYRQGLAVARQYCQKSYRDSCRKLRRYPPVFYEIFRVDIFVELMPEAVAEKDGPNPTALQKYIEGTILMTCVKERLNVSRREMEFLAVRLESIIVEREAGDKSWGDFPLEQLSADESAKKLIPLLEYIYNTARFKLYDDEKEWLVAWLVNGDKLAKDVIQLYIRNRLAGELLRNGIDPDDGRRAKKLSPITDKFLEVITENRGVYDLSLLQAKGVDLSGDWQPLIEQLNILSKEFKTTLQAIYTHLLKPTRIERDLVAESV